ncbi:MAG: TerC family protein, partial [Chlorobi bacterium]|nr:TerC family protein [Chlorobiota bacterium]
NILDKFRYLNIGLSLLLVLVGVKMILPFLPGHVHFSTLNSLIVILVIIGTSILASLIIPEKEKHKM